MRRSLARVSCRNVAVADNSLPDAPLFDRRERDYGRDAGCADGGDECRRACADDERGYCHTERQSARIRIAAMLNAAARDNERAAYTSSRRSESIMIDTWRLWPNENYIQKTLRGPPEPPEGIPLPADALPAP